VFPGKPPPLSNLTRCVTLADACKICALFAGGDSSACFPRLGAPRGSKNRAKLADKNHANIAAWVLHAEAARA
jgi:hypothetical protein